MPEFVWMAVFAAFVVVVGVVGIRGALAAYRDIKAAEPDINSQLIKVGGPVLLAGSGGVILAAIGDQKGNQIVVACGLILFGLAVAAWFPFVTTRMKHVKGRWPR